MNETRWGIWCVELGAWCKGQDGRPETFASKPAADESARYWQDENERHVTGRHCNPFDDWKRIEPLHYEARTFVEQPGTASSAVAASGA